MKKTILLLSILIIVVAFDTNAQKVKHKSFWGSLEMGYGFSVADNGKSYNYSYNNIFGHMYMMDIRAKCGYYLNPKLSIGAGLGLNGYHNYTINTFPVFFDIRYHLLKKMPQLFAFTDIGASIKIKESYTSGFITNVGVGYKFFSKRKLSLIPSVGYNMFLYEYKGEYFSENRARHTLFFKLGIEF